jgi:hypothetical protein
MFSLKGINVFIEKHFCIDASARSVHDPALPSTHLPDPSMLHHFHRRTCWIHPRSRISVDASAGSVHAPALPLTHLSDPSMLPHFRRRICRIHPCSLISVDASVGSIHAPAPPSTHLSDPSMLPHLRRRIRRIHPCFGVSLDATSPLLGAVQVTANLLKSVYVGVKEEVRHSPPDIGVDATSRRSREASLSERTVW